MTLRKFDLAVGETPSFIGTWFLSDTEICDELIQYYETHPNKLPGVISNENGPRLDKDFKDSVEIHFNPGTDESIFLKYLVLLQEVIEEYKKEYPSCDGYAPWSIVDQTNLQYYPPGGGFKSWHTERSFNYGKIVSRHLVFMTYLNDVTDQGETEFLHQKCKISPRKGLTVIWPADWTFTHRGIPSPTQDKYIITGWFNYLS